MKKSDEKNQMNSAWSQRIGTTFSVMTVILLLMFSFASCNLAVSEPTESEMDPVHSEFQGPPLPTAMPTMDPDAKYIALTFDDGPISGNTERLLSILEENEVLATFFVLGQRAESYPDLIRAIDAAGHEIGNHTYDHTVLTNKSVSNEDIAYQIDKTNEIIQELTGKTPISFRAPQGSFNADVLSVAKDRGMSVYSWSYQSCPEDWKNKDPEIIKQIVVDNAAKGHIVLLHDLHDYTLDALPDMINELKAKGFLFVTVSEIVSLGPDITPIPGKVYFYYNTPTQD